MTSLENDRAYLEAGIPELGDYLLSKELYWPISARGYNLPRLTVGGILLAQTRLGARGGRIEKLATQLDARSGEPLGKRKQAESSSPDSGCGTITWLIIVTIPKVTRTRIRTRSVIA